MVSWNVEEMIFLMLEAGKIALSFFGSCSKEFKKDHSIVTVADYTIEQFWAKYLDKPENNSYFLGEETIANKNEDYLHKAFQHVAWVIDPIDGTAVFANHLPHWGISVGLMQKGLLCEGMIFLVALGELYYTQNEKVYKQTLGTNQELWLPNLGHPVQLAPPTQDISQGSMLGLGKPFFWQKHTRLPYHIQVTGSTVFNMTKLADGSLSALVTSFRLWDFAAGLPMLYYLGWAMEYLSSEGRMSLMMDHQVLCLEPGNADRWQVVHPVVFAPSSQAVAIIRQNLLVV